MINVSLIGEKKPLQYIIILVIWNLGVLMGFTSIFFRGTIFFKILGFSFLSSFFIWIIGNLLIKSYKVTGNVEISSDSIKIIKDNIALEFDLLKTKNLILDYNGAEGDSYGYLGSMRINSGSKNTISFEYEDEIYKLKFLAKNRNFLNSIFKIVKTWKENGIDFKIMRYKKDITDKLLRKQGKF